MNISIQAAVLFFAFILHTGNQSVPKNPGTDLKIEVTGMRSDHGFVLLSLYNHKNGYPSNPDEAFWKAREKISSGKASFLYKELPPGTYAIAILHDENANMKMDTKFLGLPKEGYAFSQNPTLWFGPPSFKSASFRHDAEQFLEIPIRY